MTPLLIAALAMGTVALKVTGPVVAGGRKPPRRLAGAITLLTPALVTALVVTDTFTSGHGLALDARAAGLAAALVGLLLRAPLAVVIIGAVVVTALCRLAG